MKKLILLVGAFVILACVPPFIEPEVVVEIEGGVVMEGRLTVVNETTGDTVTSLNAKTDRLINEMLVALSTGEFDEVGMIAFVHQWEKMGKLDWDTTYLFVSYDGGGYDTCNWVRWRTGYRTYAIWDTIKYWYLLPGIIEGMPLSEAYATESDNLGMQWSDSVAVTWTYVQSAKP